MGRLSMSWPIFIHKSIVLCLEQFPLEELKRIIDIICQIRYDGRTN